MIDSNWRADISDFNSLDDLDPIEVMVHLRHNYLDAAKGALKEKHKEDRFIGNLCCQMAERLEEVIEIIYPDPSNLKN